MAERIKRKGAELLAQLTMAKAKITADGLSWQGPPTLAEVTAGVNSLTASLSDFDTKENAWRASGDTNRSTITTCRGLMQKIDLSATAKYGRGSATLLQYGLEPWGAEAPPLAKLIQIVTRDGPIAGSIFFDWENIDGATYEVQWFSDSACTQMVGSGASTPSEYVIGGLTPGNQYWMRVRPLRGGQTAPWSDPATRIAPV